MKRTFTILSGLMVLALTHHAQSDSLLNATTIQRLQGGLIQIRFIDNGTGAVVDDYILETSPTLAGSDWVEQSAIIDEQEGSFLASAFLSDGKVQFFRIRAGNIPASGGTTTASFSMSEIVQEEGSGQFAVLVEFSQTYNGLLKYSWAGAANINGLSGLLQVNGTSVSIPLTIQDNTQIDELQNLTLTLVADETTGYVVADGGASTNITVEENDAIWKGSFHSDSERIDLGLELIRRGNELTAMILSDGTGLIPEGAYEASGTPTQTAGRFSATIPAVVIQANDGNQLDRDATLSFEFDAVDGRAEDVVEAQRMSGKTTLTISRQDASHLNVVVEGRFALAKQVSAPSGTKVSLNQ